MPVDNNPYNYQLPSWLGGLTSGAGGYDTVIRTNINAASLASATAAAANAAASAAQAAAAVGASDAAIVQAARNAAHVAWYNVTGNVSGSASYATNEPGVFDYAASLLNPVTSTLTPVIDATSSAADRAARALKDAGAAGILGLLGGAGTAILIGAGALILIVLLKK